MTNCFVTLFCFKMHMVLFLDRILDVVCGYCVARVTCLVNCNSLKYVYIMDFKTCNTFIYITDCSIITKNMYSTCVQIIYTAERLYMCDVSY